MKKAILITAILVLVAGVSGAIWLSIHFEQQNAVRATQEQPGGQPSEPADADELLRLINEERKKAGIQPLISDENVRMSAQLKADDMVARGYRTHKIPGTDYTLTQEMHAWVSKSCSKSGENIIHRLDGDNLRYNQGIVKSWMNSESHRKAILDPKYTKTGMAVNTKVAVQHFCVAK